MEEGNDKDEANLTVLCRTCISGSNRFCESDSVDTTTSAEIPNGYVVKRQLS